jgi:DNA-binding beta-propeller fold protein YncE
MIARRRPRLAWIAATCLSFAAHGCADEYLAPVEVIGPKPDRVVVTADWLNRSLTVFDYARLTDGTSTASEAMWAKVDLAPYPPGPLEVEVTPDGHTAVVAVGAGFFDGPAGLLLLGPLDIPEGGALLVVDLDTLGVRAEVPTGHVPMGIAISPDGSRAYVANFGRDGAPGSTLSVIDLPGGALVEDIPIANLPEQVALSGDGTLGIVSTDGDHAIRTFETRDIAGTLSAPLTISDDPSGVALVDGTGKAVVANSFGPISYSVLDVSNLSAPELVETVGLDGVPFAAKQIPGTQEALVGIATGAPAGIARIDLSTTPSTLVETIALSNSEVGGFALGLAVDSEAKFAFVGIARDNSLSVVNLETKQARSLKWLPNTGPTHVAIQP